PSSGEAALLAAGGGLAAVDAVMQGRVRNVYSLLRPPGHHAMAAEAMGFCIFNNIVIAARHAQQSHGVRRIMIVDWDVHHGNGTQAAFYTDPDVLFLSLHQDDWYPAGWGKVGDIGAEGAEGRTVNIPLPAGTGDRGYIEAFQRVVLPVARQFEPELILVSAGQDPSMMDPNGRMLVTMEGFRSLATMTRQVADEVCDGRLAILQEGGYSPAYMPFCTLAVVEGVLGERSIVGDPYQRTPELARAKRENAPWQSAAIDAVVEAQAPYWSLR
nr:class II histone deacetylase [Chloroflexota bacterium]